MSDYKVELSGEAQDQISGIYDYIRNKLCNLSAAQSFLDDTETAVDSLKKLAMLNHYVEYSKQQCG